ncbi:MAG: helix-turn-helix domain-containing protein [Clostridia bacterium]|jgi:AraC-like DNA-binding protein|nr:helix-turn-helix domain-containing protein [Clostridia bacterium]
MLYQKILMDDEPYQLRVSRIAPFEEHRHADIELNYCVRGGFDVLVDKKRYRVGAGELVLIGPMVAHEIPPQSDGERLVLTAVVGSTFLKKHFGFFANASFRSPVYPLSPLSEGDRSLLLLLRETAELCRHPTSHSDLLITGNLYKICAFLLDALAASGVSAERETGDLRRVANIERALDLIHYEYAKPLTVEMAAAATGYGKSNFCKIFKDVVGDSFHHVLNQCRVKNAYGLLSESDMPISAVAQEVGFGEAKTFCRVFKEVTGMTPGTYRAQAKRPT